MEPVNLKGRPAIYKPFLTNVDENFNSIKASDNSFTAMTFVSGSGKVDDVPFNKGDTFFIPAGCQASIEGKFKAIIYSLD